MAGETYYAWSPILHGNGSIKVGEEVSQADLGSSDDEWRYLVRTGAVRTAPYPVPGQEAALTSPVNYLQDMAAKLAAANEAQFSFPGVETPSGPEEGSTRPSDVVTEEPPPGGSNVFQSVQ
jgi:hypothetical protein